MPAILDDSTEEEYLALVRTFPLLSIRDDAHLAEALAVIDRLTVAESPSLAVPCVTSRVVR